MRLLLALLLLATPAAAQPTPREPAAASTPAFRGAIRPGAATTPAPVRLRDPGSDLTLVPPTLARRPLIATPRYERTVSDAVGECRRACAAPYYACRAESGGACSTRFLQCQNSCRTADIPPR